MKKLLALWMALIMLFSVAVFFAGCKDDEDDDSSDGGSQSKEPQLVAGEIHTEIAGEAPQNAVPELQAWSGGVAIADDMPTQGVKQITYTVSESVMMEYIRFLQDNGFTLVDEHEFSYRGETFQEWAFTYDAKPDAEFITMWNKSTSCHITISMNNRENEYSMEISPSLRFYDTGLRQNGEMVHKTLSGLSAGAGLQRMPDGSYQTTDGRLSADVGTAMVIRDGQTEHCDARWESGEDYERLWVEGYYRNEAIFLNVPKNSLMEGDILLTDDFLHEYYEADQKDELDWYTWHTPTFALSYNGICKGPQLNENTYESLTMRLLYYQKGGHAVYYIHAKLRDAEPGEVEALVAVDMAHSSAQSFENATRIKVGETISLTYTDKEHNTHYDVYEWTITDGAGNVSIHGMENNCQVTALSKGVATVTVNYRYSVDEPHYLTGNPIATAKSKSQSYQFVIE